MVALVNNHPHINSINPAERMEAAMKFRESMISLIDERLAQHRDYHHAEERIAVLEQRLREYAEVIATLDNLVIGDRNDGSGVWKSNADLYLRILLWMSDGVLADYRAELEQLRRMKAERRLTVRLKTKD